MKLRWLLPVAAVLVAVPAAAWHSGVYFDKPPAAGGGGGLFYTGSPRERGWDCTACHLPTDGVAPASMTVTADPPELLEGHYTPGTTYALTVALDDRLGLSTGLSNHNGFALTVLGPELAPVGELQVSADFYARGDNIVATDAEEGGLHEWTVGWEAPDEAVGEVWFYLGCVDGNGANSPPDVNSSDPFGDAVAMKKWVARP